MSVMEALGNCIECEARPSTKITEAIALWSAWVTFGQIETTSYRKLGDIHKLPLSLCYGIKLTIVASDCGCYGGFSSMVWPDT